MSLLPPGFDAWLTSPPEAPVTCCAMCGEPAYDPHDREDRPHAVARDGEGVLCSALCVLRDALEHHHRDTSADGAQRVAALRDALLAGADIEVVMLRVETFSHRHGEGEATVTGFVAGVDRESVWLEGVSEDGEARIGWHRVLDAWLPAA